MNYRNVLSVNLLMASQALDKGTLSFTSIMGITDLPGVEKNVGHSTA